MWGVGWSAADQTPHLASRATWPFAVAIGPPEWEGQDKGWSHSFLADTRVLRVPWKGNVSADSIVNLLEARLVSDQESWWQVFNEPNLADLGRPELDVEHFVGGPNELCRILQNAYGRLSLKVRWDGKNHLAYPRVLRPPMSPFSHESMKLWLSALDVIPWRRTAVHAYGDLNRMQEDIMAAVTHDATPLPFYVTECAPAGNVSIDAAAEWAAKDLSGLCDWLKAYFPNLCKGVAVFAPEWPNADGGFEPRFWRGTAVEHTMSEINRRLGWPT